MLYLIVLLISLIENSFTIQTNLTYRNDRQRLFLQSLESYDILNPIKIKSSGDFLTRKIIHSVEEEEIKFADEILKRKKKDEDLSSPISNYKINTNQHGTYSNGRINENPAVIHYQLYINGNNYIVDLELNKKLRSSNLIIEKNIPSLLRKEKNNNTNFYSNNRDYYSQKKCNFLGKVRNLVNSNVALSTCYGLHGYIDFGFGDNLYFIEPLVEQHMIKPVTPGSHRTKRNTNIVVLYHPHVIYKRLAVLRSSSSSKDFHFFTKLGNNIFEREEKYHNNSQSINKYANKRVKRNVSKERYVETMVALDWYFQQHYKNEDLIQYVLTIMNMVAGVYHHASVGNAIHITVVRIYLLKNDESDFKINNHEDVLLERFCEWETSINPTSDDHPHHHDNAVLLTRVDICGVNCKTVGYAYTSGMCQKKRSCSIIEDSGITVYSSIAHEMGHNFGMRHDSFDNYCYPRTGMDNYVMSPIILHLASPVIFSNCSRDAITNFFRFGWGKCLEDEPASMAYRYPIILPGQLYDIEHQCRFYAGDNYRYCFYEDVNICKEYFCVKNNTQNCISSGHAAIVGTKCENNKWCYNGRCVEESVEILKIDGVWSEWKTHSSFSRSCGVGVSSSIRLCNNPTPENGGKYCIGERVRYRICQKSACPKYSSSIRSFQCSQKNKRSPEGDLLTWEPLYNKYINKDPCKLICQSKTNAQILFEENSIDGTPCLEDTENLCITGICRNVGCDLVLDSQAKKDACGTCQGDGTSCEIINTTVSINPKLQGYYKIGTIPKGSFNVKISKNFDLGSFFAVKNYTNNYYLNENWKINYEGYIKAAGSILYYQIKDDHYLESIKITGPINEDLIIELAFLDESSPVNYEYTILLKDKDTITHISVKDSYEWRSNHDSKCSVTCGEGVKISFEICFETKTNIQVANNLCSEQNSFSMKIPCILPKCLA